MRPVPRHGEQVNRLARDRGAYAVMYAILSLALVGVVSIVIDLAALRLDRRIDRAAADAAAIAGAGQLGEAGGSPRSACGRAMDYVAANLGEQRTIDGCVGFPQVSECDPDTGLPIVMPAARTVDETIGGRTIRVTWPVLDSDVLINQPDVEGATTIGITLPALATDGMPCQRLGVEIVHQRDFAFAGVFGISDATTRSRSVGLAIKHSTGDIPVPLVALDPASCAAIELLDGDVDVGENLALGTPGEIAVDSACGTDPTIDVTLPGGHLFANRIGSFGDHTTPYPGVTADVWLSRGWRVTDRPWMDRYNCQPASEPPPVWSPTLCGKPTSIDTPLDYIDQWIDYATAVSDSPALMPGYPDTSSWPPPLTGPACAITPTTPLVGDVHTDCGGRVTILGPVTFPGRLATVDEVIVLGGPVTFTGLVHVGDTDRRDMTIENSSAVSFMDQTEITGRLSVVGPGTSAILHGAAIVDRLSLEGSAEITARSALSARAEGSVTSGDPCAQASVCISDQARASFDDDLLTRTGMIVQDGSEVAVVDRLAVRSLAVSDSARLTADGRLLARQSMSVGGGTPLPGEPAPTAGLHGSVIVRGTLTVAGSACVVVDSSSGPPSCAGPVGTNRPNVYLGNLTVADSGEFVAQMAFVYVSGRVQMAATSQLRLVAPTDIGTCTPAAGPSTVPSPRCFEDLALWADNQGAVGNVHTVRLNADDEIEGAVVTPNGQLTLRWGGLLNLNHIQVVAQRLIFDADDPSDRLTIRPDPERTTLIPESAGTLIR